MAAAYAMPIASRKLVESIGGYGRVRAIPAAASRPNMP